MHDDQLITSAFLSDPQVRPLLNWKGIEQAAAIGAFRIKNLVGQGTAMSDEEHRRLLETLASLSIHRWAEQTGRIEQTT